MKQNDDAAGGVRTLYIDRDPSTFQDICLHLRGEESFRGISAQFSLIIKQVIMSNLAMALTMYECSQTHNFIVVSTPDLVLLILLTSTVPRLVAQLFDSEIFIQIGSAHYQIPRDIFSSPGNTPNFFSLGFAAFFSSPDEVFPGLDRQGLLRPPSILPPTVPNRSATVFAELIHLLQGYPLHIRDNDHRTDLLRDCRYFHLRGLEQKLIMHDISYNSERNKSEIILRLEDIRQSGVSFAGDVSPSDRSPLGGWVNYVRPFVDEKASELIIEIGDESNKLDFRNMRADFYGHAKARISSLFQVVANKMNLPTEVPLGLMMAAGGANAQPASPGNTPLSKDRVRFRIERDCHVILDGEDWSIDTDEIDYQAGSTHPQGAFLEVSQQAGSTPLSASQSPSQTGGWPLPGANDPSPRKRKRRGSLEEFGEWIVRKGQWRLRVQPRLDQRKDGMEIVLHAVKLDAVSGQRGRNMMRSFLN